MDGARINHSECNSGWVWGNSDPKRQMLHAFYEADDIQALDMCAAIAIEVR